MAAFWKSNQRVLTWAGYLIVALALLWLVQNQMGDRPPARLVQTFITGLLTGGVYALIAVGIVIINKASGVFNFAHGWMMLFGGLVFWSFFSSGQIAPLAAVLLAIATAIMVFTMGGLRDLLNPRTVALAVVTVIILSGLMLLPGQELRYVRGLAGAVVGAVLSGLVVERFAIRPLIGQPLFAMVLMTLAIAEVLNGITQLVWGSVEIPLLLFVNPDGTSLSTIRIDASASLGGNIIIQPGLLIAFGLSLLAFIAFVLFFQFTNVGLAMRASAENQRLAQAVGLRVRVILAVAWAIAALLATTGGVLQGGATSLSLNMPLLALLAFPAVLLGGLESISGAMIGGLVIGVLEKMADLLFPGTQAGTELVPYLVLMVVLVIKPDGLFGQKRIERI